MPVKSKKYRGCVLVVDDEWLVRWSLEKTLIKHEFTVTSSESATEALELIKTNSFDWLITDLKLPEIDGLKLIQVMKDKNPDGRSILITAFGSQKIRKKAKRLGAFFIKKPFDVEDLVNGIATNYFLTI